MILDNILLTISGAMQTYLVKLEQLLVRMEGNLCFEILNLVDLVSYTIDVTNKSIYYICMIGQSFDFFFIP